MISRLSWEGRALRLREELDRTLAALAEARAEIARLTAERDEWKAEARWGARPTDGGTHER